MTTKVEIRNWNTSTRSSDFIRHDDFILEVVLWDDYQKKKIQTLRSFYDVKNVALRRDVIVVVSEYRVYLYSTQTLKVLCFDLLWSLQQRFP